MQPSSPVARGLLSFAVVMSGLGLSAAAAPAAIASSPAAQFVADTNSARSAAGLPPLAVASDITAVADRWAASMASAGAISHNPALESAIPNWMAVGENVGRGPDVASLNAAFMASAPHRANILDHDYTQIGVGTATGSDGTLYVVEDFREPMPGSSGGSGGGSTAPALKPAPKPAPVATARAGAPAPSASTPATPAATVPHHRTRAQVLRARLRARLAAARASLAHRSDGDPVARAVGFADAMAAMAAPSR